MNEQTVSDERLKWIRHLIAEEDVAPNWTEWLHRWEEKNGGPGRKELDAICCELLARREADRLAEPSVCQKLVDWWRAASNVMSEAEGDGPYRDTLRDCAKQIEEALTAPEPPAGGRA